MQFFARMRTILIWRKSVLVLLILVYSCLMVGMPVSADDLESALALVDKGNHRLAVSKLKALLSPELSEPEKREIHHVLGYCYEKLNNRSEAVRHYTRVAFLSYPLADCAIYRLARLYEDMKNDTRAIKEYSQLVKDYPSSFYHTEAKWALAQLYLKQEKYEAAKPLLTTLVENTRYARKATYALARCNEELENVTDAYRAYQQLLTDRHSDAVAEKTLGRLKLLARQDMALMLTQIDRVNCGLVFFHHGKWKAAISEFTPLTYSSNLKLRGRALYFLGKCHQGQKWYNSALKKYNAVIALGDKTQYLTRAYYQIAQCYKQKGSLQSAINRLENFVKTYTWSELVDDALYDLAQIHEKQKKSELAMKVYERLIAAAPKSEYADWAAWRIAWQRFDEKRYEESYQFFKGIKENFPGNRYAMGAHFWMAKIRERQNKPILAQALYTEVARAGYWYYSARAKALLGISPSELEPRAIPNTQLPPRTACPEQVEMLMKLSLYEDAIYQLTHHIQAAPKTSQACFYALISCYERLAQYDKAREVVEKALASPAFENQTRTEAEKLQQLLYPRHYASLIEKYAKLYQVDAFLIFAMILEESRYRADAISWAGAIGLMQIMPATGRELARQLKIRRFRTTMLKNPEINIQMGVKYIRYLNSLFDSDAMLVTGAYNGGPGRMKRWVSSKNIKDIDEFVEKITIRETRLHIKKVINSYDNYVEIYGQPEVPAVNSASDIQKKQRKPPILGQLRE